MSRSNSMALNIQLACIWEATARKPGNVHRYRDFADTTYVDFLQSAAVFAPILAADPERPVGPTVLEAVQGSRVPAATHNNPRLLLFLAPPAQTSPPGSFLRALPR